jgi:rod shape-determining protein MreB
VLKLFDQTIYVQVEKDAFVFLHVQSGNKHKATGNFSNPRLAIAHFNPANEALRQGISVVYPKSFFQASPTIVMHQMCNNEGGLCEIELRILKELALGSGARQVYIWQGNPLTNEQLLNKTYAGI